MFQNGSVISLKSKEFPLAMLHVVAEADTIQQWKRGELFRVVDGLSWQLVMNIPFPVMEGRAGLPQAGPWPGSMCLSPVMPCYGC